MRLWALAVGLAAFHSAWAADPDWRLVGVGSADGSRHYVDVANRRPDKGNERPAWIKVDLKEADKDGDVRIVSLGMFNCTDFSRKYVHMVGYKANGQTSTYRVNPESQFATPGSIGMAVLEFVCDLPALSRR
jgi:hypothetical protein